MIAKGKKVLLPPPLITGRALTFNDWDVIINYINILSLIHEITKILKASVRKKFTSIFAAFGSI